LQRLFYENAFKNHPYRNSPYGDKASIAAITAKDLHHFMFEHFRRYDVKISIVGDVDADLVKQNILPYFAKLPSPKHLPHSLPKTQIAAFTKPLHYEMNVPQSNVMLVHHGINRKSELFYAAYVLQHILGGGSLSSKLGQKLREEHGLVYGVNASFVQTDASEWFVTNFATKNETAGLAIKLANEVISKAANGEITETELQEAKQYLIGSFALATDSNADRLQYLSMMQRYDLGVDYLEKRNDLIAAVNLKQLQQAAKILQGAPLMILSVGKQALISD
jgi:zinc protease